MTARTPGQKLIAALNKSLKGGTEWDERERVTLGLIEEAANRVAVLKVIFDQETIKPAISTRRVTEVSAEIRMNEANIGRWVATLDPQMEQAKSLRHQYAANKRWHGAS